jgi:hypothetical protein
MPFKTTGMFFKNIYKMIISKASVQYVLSEGISSRNLRSSSRWRRILHQKFQSVIIVKTSKNDCFKSIRQVRFERGNFEQKSSFFFPMA